MVSREENLFNLRNLTNDVVKPYDISRLRKFIVRPGVDIREVAAADLGEFVVIEILGHKGKGTQTYRYGVSSSMERL